jgi:hypothetical protein
MEQEFDDYDPTAFAQGQRESDEQYEGMEQYSDQDLTAEAEMWADMVATENAYRIRDGRPTLTP